MSRRHNVRKTRSRSRYGSRPGMFKRLVGPAADPVLSDGKRASERR